jgi:uncharacterized protein (TIGR02594 family)
MTLYDLAERFIGIREVAGSVDNPQIMAMLNLDHDWPTHDEVAWCSAFLNYVAWLGRWTRSKDLRARSWLTVGKKVWSPVCGGDIVVLANNEEEAGSMDLDLGGHVGLYVSSAPGFIEVLGGNQSNGVSVARFPYNRLIDFRRIHA